MMVPQNLEKGICILPFSRKNEMNPGFRVFDKMGVL